MSAERPAKGLGMGLSALLGEASRPATGADSAGAVSPKPAISPPSFM